MSLAKFALGGSIRNITFERTASINSTIIIKRDVSTVTFDNVDTYRNQPPIRQKIVQDVVQFAKDSGLDEGGAEAVSIPGGFHSGGGGVDTFSRLTATVKDKSGNLLYFFRITDETFWKRVHIPQDLTGKDWPTKPIYKAISEEDFNNKKAPPHK